MDFLDIALRKSRAEIKKKNGFLKKKMVRKDFSSRCLVRVCHLSVTLDLSAGTKMDLLKI